MAVLVKKGENMYFVSTREEDDCKELYCGAWSYYLRREDAVDAVHRKVN